MFKKSFLLVVTVLILVFTSAFTTQMLINSNLPSSYDSGLTIQKAFQTSKVPLLVEFYSDTCGTCQKVAPLVHEIGKQQKNRLTVVMMNVEEPDTQDIAQLFGVTELPALFVFDFKKMKKQKIDSTAFGSKEALEKAIAKALPPAS